MTPEPTPSSPELGSKDPNSEEEVLLEAVSIRWPVNSDLATDALKARSLEDRWGNLFTAVVILVAAIVTIFVSDGIVQGTAGVVFIVVAVTLAIAAIVLGIRGYLRRISIKDVRRRFEEGSFADTCPGCGQDPFEPNGCCRRFPQGWSRLDLHGFWHELAVARETRGKEQEKLTWNRCRGPAGTSGEYPRLGLGSLMRHILRQKSTIAFVAVVVVFTVVGWMIVQGNVNRFIQTMILVGVLGYMLLATGLGLRRKPPIGTPTRPRCAKCHYQLHPPFPERCPECGKDLVPWDSITFDPDEPVLAGGTAQILRDRLQKKRKKND